MRSILEHVQSYEITYPTWLPPHRHRRSANIEVSHSASPTGPLANKMIKTLDVDISQLLFSELLVPDGPHVFWPFQYPTEALVLISAEGQELRLRLEKNE